MCQFLFGPADNGGLTRRSAVRLCGELTWRPRGGVRLARTPSAPNLIRATDRRSNGGGRVRRLTVATTVAVSGGGVGDDGGGAPVHFEEGEADAGDRLPLAVPSVASNSALSSSIGDGGCFSSAAPASNLRRHAAEHRGKSGEQMASIGRSRMGKKSGIRDDGHFKSINTGRCWYKSDPFILTTQATKVFYVPDTDLRGNWQVVQKFQHRHLWSVKETEMEKGLNGGGGLTYQE